MYAIVIVATLAVFVILCAGCAIAIGDRSSAAVVNKTGIKREVVEDTPVIEEVLLETVKKDKSNISTTEGN